MRYVAALSLNSRGFDGAGMVSEFADSLQICTEHKPCEIDPVKLKESENLETNRVRGDGWMMGGCVFVVSE